MKFLSYLFICVLISNFDLFAMERDDQNWKKKSEEEKEHKKGFRNYFIKFIKSSSTDKKQEKSSLTHQQDDHRKQLRRSNSTFNFKQADKLFGAIINNDLKAVEECVKNGYLSSNLIEIKTENTFHMVALKNYFLKVDRYQGPYDSQPSRIKKAEEIVKKIFSPQYFSCFDPDAVNGSGETILGMVEKRKRDKDLKFFRELVAGMCFVAIAQNANTKFDQFFKILKDPNVIDKETGNNLFMAVLQAWGKSNEEFSLNLAMNSGELLSPLADLPSNSVVVESLKIELKMRTKKFEEMIGILVAPEFRNIINRNHINNNKMTALKIIKKYNIVKGFALLQLLNVNEGMEKNCEKKIKEINENPEYRAAFFGYDLPKEEPKKGHERRLSTQLSAKELLDAALYQIEKDEERPVTWHEYPVNKEKVYEEQAPEIVRSKEEVDKSAPIIGRQRRVSFALSEDVSKKAEQAKKRASYLTQKDIFKQTEELSGSQSSYKNGSSSDDEFITTVGRRLSKGAFDEDPDNNNRLS